MVPDKPVTEADSPEVDNKVLIPAQDQYLRIGDFAQITITDASEFDLVGRVAYLSNTREVT